MKGHFSCGDSFPLASLAKQDLYLETLAMALSGKAAAYPVHAELNGEVSRMVGGGVAPVCLLHMLLSLLMAPKVPSLDRELLMPIPYQEVAGQSHTLDLHVVE